MFTVLRDCNPGVVQQTAIETIVRVISEVKNIFQWNGFPSNPRFCRLAELNQKIGRPECEKIIPS